jgi:phage terminase large subunit GpA-like protein
MQLQTTQRQTPDDWARMHRTYGPETGVPGPRDPALTPYVIPFVRAFSDPRYRRVVLVCGAQMGKTDSQLDLIGEKLDNRPTPLIYVAPSKEFATDQFEPRLVELFRQTPSLASKVLGGFESKRQKKTLKRVAGVTVRLAHAGSAVSLMSSPCGLALVDEYDTLLRDVQKHGDPLGLIEARGLTFADFVIGVCSTPSKGSVEPYTDGASGLELWAPVPPEDLESPIWALWQQGTMFHWAWPCVQCGEYFVPRFSCLKWDGDKPTPFEARETAYLVCPRCGGVHEDKDKAEMNRRGRYVAPGQGINQDGDITGDPPQTSTASFWVSGLASPFVTWGQRVEDHVRTVRLGDMDRIRTSINASFGELHAPGVGELPEWSEVMKHRGDYARGELPAEVMALVLTVDVQKNRLVMVLRGWGARATSWLIDWGEIDGDPAEPAVWSDLMDLIQTPLHDMMIKAVLIDSGFRPGKIDEVPVHRVYDFALRFPRQIKACKGSSWPMRVPIMRTKIEVDRQGSAAKKGLTILRLDSDHWKSWVHERLRWPLDQPGAWWLPRDVDEEYCKQIVSETRTRTPSGRVTWVQRFKENHFLDCEALQAAAGYLIGAHRTQERAEPRAPPVEESTELQQRPMSPLANWYNDGRKSFWEREW